MFRRSLLVGALGPVGAVLVAARAGAQTTPPAAIIATEQVNPNRLIGGQMATQRPQNLNPLGINYQDCVSDMVLQFNLLGTNFNGSERVEAWAGTQECTSDMARGFGSPPVCWQVAGEQTGFLGSGFPIPVTIRVQDIVGHQGPTPPNPPAYVPVGSSGCLAQTVDTAQDITVFIMPTDSMGHGDPWQHRLLVCPGHRSGRPAASRRPVDRRR